MKLKSVKIRVWYFFVLILLLIAFVFRVYRINELLGFYYDQGRDALIVWDLIHKGKFFLIGPTTGIEGIFRGPWYYWLIAPFYWLGKGNPVYPSVFLSGLTVLAVYILYCLADDIGGKYAGIIALLIGCFSFTFVSSSRWLSNPTPMYLIGILFVLTLTKLADGKMRYLYQASILAGFAMQFGSATEIFYIPCLIIAVYVSKKKCSLKQILLSVLLFLLPFIPQILFDIRHQGVLSKAVYNFLFERESFGLSFWKTVENRLPFYFSVIENKIWPVKNMIFNLIFAIVLLSLFINKNIILKNKKIFVVIVTSLIPFIGMLFFQGNNGNVYDYYFTGYYFVLILLFSILFAFFSKKLLGKLLIAVFIILFLSNNLPLIFNFLKSDYRRNDMITLANQKEAIDWIYKDVCDKPFNIDVYVPPVIPYAYDYLFTWYGDLKYNRLPKLENEKLLYTLAEYDLERPERLYNWEVRQNTIGKVIKEESFGLIKVQKRERIIYE